MWCERYRCRVDRVDRWLNAQRGWRRLLIGWLALAPVLVDFGLLWSSWGNFDDQATVATRSVLVRVAIAALVGVPLADVMTRLQMRWRKSRPWAPQFSWRTIAATYVFMAGACAASYGETRTLAWQHQHLPYRALYISDGAACVLFIWDALYRRKLRRQAEDARLPAS